MSVYSLRILAHVVCLFFVYIRHIYSVVADNRIKKIQKGNSQRIVCLTHRHLLLRTNKHSLDLIILNRKLLLKTSIKIYDNLMQALSFVDCSSHNIFRFKIFKAVHDKAAYFGLATEIIMCVSSLINRNHMM